MRIAILSDNPTMSTGYGQIARYLGYGLSQHHEVTYVGLQHRGDVIKYTIKDRDIFMYPGAVYRPGDSSLISRSLETINPDVTIMTRDMVTFSQRFQQWFSLAQYKGKITRISYLPLMSRFYPLDVVRSMLDSTDQIATYTEAARLALMDLGVPYNIMRTINCGYDPEVFTPDGPKDYFDTGGDVFTFVGLMFDTRKRVGILLKAFREYLVNYDHDATLYIHNMPTGTAYDVPAWAAMLGISGHIIFPPQWNNEWGLPHTEIARIYRSSKAVVSMSPEEGFNMPFLEAMACGVPVVGCDMPFYDWSDQILKVPSIEAEEGSLAVGYMSDPKVFAEYMDRARSHKIDTEKLKPLQWGNIVAQFERMLQEVKE